MQVGPLMNDESATMLFKMMQMAMDRQNVLANNIANADTPGYTRKELSFQEQLASIVKSGDYKELSELKGALVDDKTNPARLDGNNIVLPKEMSEMTQNSMLHKLLARAYTTKVNILRDAIRSGGG